MKAIAKLQAAIIGVVVVAAAVGGYVTYSTFFVAPPREVAARFSLSQGFQGAYLPWHVLADRDLFKKNNIAAQVEIVRGTGEVVKALSEGRADIGGIATSAFAAALEKGLKAKVIFFVDNGFFAGVVVRPDSPFRTVEDMRGKTIKVGISAPGAYTHVMAAFLADALNTELGKGVIPVGLRTVDALVAALTRGEIDAMTWTSDVLFDLQEKGKARLIVDFGKVYGGKWNDLALVATDEFIAKDPEAVKRVVQTIKEAVSVYKNDRGYATRVLAKSLGISQSLSSQLYESYVVSETGRLNQDILENMRKVLIGVGLTKNPPPVGEWFTTQFL